MTTLLWAYRAIPICELAKAKGPGLPAKAGLVGAAGVGLVVGATEGDNDGAALGLIGAVDGPPVAKLDGLVELDALAGGLVPFIKPAMFGLLSSPLQPAKPAARIAKVVLRRGMFLPPNVTNDRSLHVPQHGVRQTSRNVRSDSHTTLLPVELDG